MKNGNAPPDFDRPKVRFRGVKITIEVDAVTLILLVLNLLALSAIR
jgi:hypothetical protein